MPSRLVLVALVAIAAASYPLSAASRRPDSDYAAPRFTATDRKEKIAQFAPEIDREFQEFATKKKVPGLIWGIVLDGELVHSGTFGLAQVDQKIPVTLHTSFRIASMTKSFTALAILKLRDAGRLSLADPLEKYVPEIKATRHPASDAPDITLQHLLTMSAGFPEDNPWGDRQLAVSDAQLGDFLRRGLSLANVPGQAFEYSNLGYALLGRIISQVAGIPYQEYIRREIMSPLGMKDTHWEYRDVPPNRLALGYRSAGDSWQPEPLLGDGSYGAMGGLLTTLPDFARYAAFHLAAWPARNEPDSGPVRRATLREMHQTGVHSGLNASAKSLAGEPLPSVSTYGNGLGWSIDSRGTIRVGHSGGLPGFGSNWRFYPDHGFAVISFANLTYAGTGAVNSRVGAILVEKAGLPRRTLPVPPLLEKRKLQVAELLQKWNPALADSLVAENFFLDRSREEWIRHSSSTLARIGAVKSLGELVPENLLRGTFHLVGETGKVEVFFTLTPEATPLLQELQIKFIAP